MVDNSDINSILASAGTGSPVNTTGVDNSDINSILDSVGNSTDQSTSTPQLTGQVWPDFQAVAAPIAKEYNFPLGVLLGQAALESARGQSAPGNNYFGIKGSGNAGTNNLATQEYGTNGYYGENDNFAAYQTPQDSIKAYLNLVMSYPGVPEAVATGDPNRVLQAIEAAGYATDPTYVQQVESTPEFQQNLP